VRAGRGWEGRGGGGDRLKGTRGPFKDPGVLLKDPRVLLKDPGALLKDPGALLKDPGVLSKDPGDLLKDPGVLLKDPRGGVEEWGGVEDPDRRIIGAASQIQFVFCSYVCSLCCSSIA